LLFASDDWETPAGTYSVSSISHSTKSPSRRSAVATHPPPAAKRAKRTPNATVEGKGSSLYDADDGGDKYDNDDDIIPATDGPMVTTAQDAADDMFIAEKAAELIEKHRQEFMKRAFSVRTLATDVPLTTASASIKMCRPLKDIDYIIYPQELACGCQYKLIEPCPEKESISKFRKANHNGAKYVKQYVLEDIVVPGSDTPRTVLRRLESGAIGRIVVSREEVLYCIDEWHRDNGHMGQERTWGYCKEKYWNVAQALVKHYCET
jgi:hypothetical protein